MSVVALGELTWREVAELVTPGTVALWPVGAVEAHGPHLPLTTDVIISEETARRAARKLEKPGRNILILPALAFTPATYAGDFAGTISISIPTATAQMVEVAESLARHGLKTLALVNSHVDPANLAAIREAVAGITRGGRLKVVFPDITAKPWVLRMPDEFKTGGAHAGHVETSFVMAAKPALVREAIRRTLPKVDINLAKKIRDGAKTFHDCGGAEAYFGDPASASAADGERYYEILADIVSESVEAIR